MDEHDLPSEQPNGERRRREWALTTQRWSFVRDMTLLIWTAALTVLVLWTVREVQHEAEVRCRGYVRGFEILVEAAEAGGTEQGDLFLDRIRAEANC